MARVITDKAYSGVNITADFLTAILTLPNLRNEFPGLLQASEVWKSIERADCPACVRSKRIRKAVRLMTEYLLAAPDAEVQRLKSKCGIQDQIRVYAREGNSVTSVLR